MSSRAMKKSSTFSSPPRGLFKDLPDGRLGFYPHFFRRNGYAVPPEIAESLRHWRPSSSICAFLDCFVVPAAVLLTIRLTTGTLNQQLFLGTVLGLFGCFTSHVVVSGLRIRRVVRGLESAPPRAARWRSFISDLPKLSGTMSWLNIFVFMTMCVPLVIFPLATFVSRGSPLTDHDGLSLFLIFPLLIGLPILAMLMSTVWFKLRTA